MEAVLIFVCLVASQGNAKATDKATQAAVIQLRVDESLDRYQKVLFTEVQRRRLGDAALVTKIIVERKITLRWEFP